MDAGSLVFVFVSLIASLSNQSSFCYLRQVFLVADPLGLSNAPWMAYEDQNAALSRPICGNIVPWVEPKIDDVLNCFLFKENCSNFGRMIVCPFGHRGLDDPPVNLICLALMETKCLHSLGISRACCTLQKAIIHVFVPCVWLDAGFTFQHA